MKKALLPTVCILLCTLCIACIPTEADAAIYENTLRLHILAPSDSVEDQALKLMIRDRVLEKYGTMIKSTDGIEDAEKKISASLESIETDCKSWIAELGYSYDVSVPICKEWYNTREYSEFILPSGNYLSLKITLGNGDGQNWWCVMYPPLCLDAATGDYTEIYSQEEQKLITKDGYRVRFKLLEVASEIFSNKKY